MQAEMKTYRRLSLTVIASLAAITALFFFTAHKESEVAGQRLHADRAVEFDRFYLTGVSASKYEGGRTSFSFDADRIVHRKRRAKFFVYQNIKEIYISNLKMDAYAGASVPSADGKATAVPLGDMFDIFTMLNGSQTPPGEYPADNPDPNLSLLSRVVIDGLTMNMHLHNGQMVVIAARGAIANAYSGNLVFEESARVVFSNGEELTAPVGVWSKEFKGIYLPKGYLFRNDYHRERAFFRITEDGRFLNARQIPDFRYLDPIKEKEEVLYSNISGKIPASAAFALGIQRD